MKQFLTILKFELDNYFKSKSYIISTILIAVLAAGIMFVPRVKESFSSDKKETESNQEEMDQDEIEENTILIYDKTGLVVADEVKTFFTDKIITMTNSEEEIEEAIKNEKANAGFVVTSIDAYDYYVLNKGMFDENEAAFNEYMALLVKVDYCQSHDLDLDEFMEASYKEIQVNEKILGKDSAENYWYCYILVILIFMLIIMYGMSIASSVTNEKSNRSIEILVTSTDSTALLFGKVFAGAIATVFQVGLIAGALLGSYQYNKDFWNIDIGAFLDIPTEVLITFAIFGIGGFLFYAFMYGALGALVSKIEDLNKSAGTAQMLIMIVYFVVLLQLTNIDGVAMKVCSFLPFSSYSAMFARVGMGSVEMWEIVVSAVILYVSVVIMGFIGGKIFRSSTLRYGNPIKLSTALKNLKNKE
ncbi:MAG: ABC transporter permease [Wujia sp.]